MNENDTILIIDDELQIRRLLEITLSANGYKTIHSSNGKDGLLDAATHHPSIIILDLGLPDIDGCAAAGRNAASKCWVYAGAIPRDKASWRKCSIGGPSSVKSRT